MLLGDYNEVRDGEAPKIYLGISRARQRGKPEQAASTQRDAVVCMAFMRLSGTSSALVNSGACRTNLAGYHVSHRGILSWKPFAAS